MTRRLSTAAPLWVCLMAAASCAPAPPGHEPVDVAFDSEGARLSGSIVLPAGGPPRAAVVFVHGSGRQPRDIALARRFAAAGIAALVYDKRGVGRSAGVFTPGFTAGPDLERLAADAAAALALLDRYPPLRGVPAGLAGFSQAGWIVPLAAARSPTARFIALWSGPVCRTSEEDVYSQYTSDRDFATPPPFELIQRVREEPYVWNERFGRDIDPLDSLRRITMPGLWVFGREDGSIPVDLSVSRLEQLRREGRKGFGYVVFSGVGHATIDASFTTVTSWIVRAAEAAPAAAGAPLGGDAARGGGDLQQYVGVYASADPAIEVTFARGPSGLVAAARGRQLPLEYVGGSSFAGHDVGRGYLFLDFSADARTVSATQQGQMFTLRRVDRQPRVSGRPAPYPGDP